MAVISDPTTAIGARVSDAGSLLISTGDDGLPTYYVPIYHPRITTALATGAALWAIRAPVTRTVVLQGGQLRISLDTTLGAMAEVGVDMVRFSGADPSAGNVYIPARKRTADPDPQTLVVRAATATAGVTMTTSGLVVEASNNIFFRLDIPGIAGANSVMDFSTWVGLELAPGEGLALLSRPASAPIGMVTSGWVEFSEKV